MFFSLIGLFALLLGFALAVQKNQIQGRIPFKTAGTALILVGLAIISSATFTVIGVGEVGVVHAFGKVDAQPINSGVHFVRPWADVEKYSIREIQFPSGGTVEQMDALSREQMAVEIEVAVRYSIHPDEVVALYQRIGDEAAVEAAVLNAIRAGVRDGMARHAISDIQDRDSIARSMSNNVQEKLVTGEPNSVHIAHLTQLFLRKITPPTKIAEAINAKIAQEQQIQTETFKVQVEAQKAKQRVTEAQGIADAQRIINVTLSPQYLMHEYITSLVQAAASPGTTIIFPTDGGMPLFDMNSFQRRLGGGGRGGSSNRP
jgi:regulator of protease activity HflC (stomatin/prohibitin superfamily)